MNKQLANTLRRQREAVQVEPIHKDPAPVHAYAKHISDLKGEKHHVVTIPEGSSAYGMGYRFVSVPGEELQHYLAQGCKLVEKQA